MSRLHLPGITLIEKALLILLVAMIDGPWIDTSESSRLNVGAIVALCALPFIVIWPRHEQDVRFMSGRNRLGVVALVLLALAGINRQPEERPRASLTCQEDPADRSVTFATTTTTSGRGGSIAWDFGDGETQSGSSAGHTYARSGSYVVTMTVSDSHGRATATCDVDLSGPG